MASDESARVNFPPLKRSRKDKRTAGPEQPAPLPTSVQDLQAMVIALQHQVAQLQRMLFGRRSEKLPADHPSQGFLFGRIEPQEPAAEPETPQASTEATAPENESPAQDEEPAPHKQTRHRGRRPLPAHLMRCVHEIHPPAGERTCPSCQHAKTVFGADVTEELEMIPARFFVNRYVRHKYACRHCQGSVSQGPLPPRPLEKGIPGPGVLADLIASKYAEHLPLYRMQERYRRAGIELTRSTLCDWVSHVAGLTAPIVEALKRMVISSRKVHTDDTGITVLDPGAEPVGSRRGYMWVYIGDHDDVVFDFTVSHQRDGPASFLADYRGYLQADAFSGYDGIYTNGLIWEVACWAHARRKFYDTLVHYPAAARRVLDMIGRLYAVESRAGAMKVSPEKRLAWRQRFSRRRLAQLRLCLDQLAPQVLPKSPLGKAISYTLRNWKALNRYTEAPWLNIDNNHSERQIKQLVIGRKNWLFAGSDEGARNAAICFSLIVSCKLAGVDPFAYLRDVLTRIHNHPPDRIHELIPREWKARFGTATPVAA